MTGDTSSRSISQEQINAFGLASGGTGLIHTDPEYARRTKFGAPLVQGLYLFALVERQLAERDPKWAERGVLEATFVGPVKAGEEFHVEITDDADDADQTGRVLVRASTPEGEAIAGSAWLRSR
ncbi:MAG: hypothetical protein GEV03_29110 [Streptosporangiales bacterium]|nr:hypothetical protein [Streptosporangiales bacterium]